MVEIIIRQSLLLFWGHHGPSPGPGLLTWVGTVGHDQHAQGAEADVPLASLSQERPVHVPGLHHCCLGCRGTQM